MIFGITCKYHFYITKLITVINGSVWSNFAEDIQNSSCRRMLANEYLNNQTIIVPKRTERHRSQLSVSCLSLNDLNKVSAEIQPQHMSAYTNCYFCVHQWNLIRSWKPFNFFQFNSVSLLYTYKTAITINCKLFHMWSILQINSNHKRILIQCTDKHHKTKTGNGI